MNKKFITNLAFLIIVNLIVKPFWIFGIDRTVQNTVGEAMYGTYFTLFNYTLLFHILLDIGINNFNNKAIAQKPSLLTNYFSNILVIKSLLSIIYLVVCFSGAIYLQYDEQQLQLLSWLCLNQILLSFILYFRSNLGGLQLFRQDSLVSVLDKSIMILLGGILLSGYFTKQTFQISWFIYLQTVAYALTCLVSFSLVYRQYTIQSFTWQFGFLKEVLKQSYPFALLGLLMSVYNRIDAVMLEYLLPIGKGSKEVGIYAAAYRLLDAVNMIAYLFATLLLPMFANMIANQTNLIPLVNLSAKLLFTGATILAINCFIFQEPIIKLLYPAATSYYASILGYLMLSFIAISSVYVYGTLLTANGNLWPLNAIAIGGCLLNLGLNYYLIPQYGALGATIATVITQTIVALIHLFVAVKILALPTSIKAVFQIVLYIIICFIITKFMFFLPLIWWINSGLAMMATLIIAILWKIIDVQEIWTILTNRVSKAL